MNKININVFCYEDKVVYRVHLSDQNFKDCLDLLLISNHCVYIIDFNRLMFNKNKCKNEKWFCKSCLQCFSGAKVLKDHGGDCLLINGGQKVKLEKEFTELKNITDKFQLLECLLKNVHSGINNDCFNYTSKYQEHVTSSFAYKLVCANDKYSKDLVLHRGKNAVFKFIQCIFKEYSYCKDVIKKHFNNNLVVTPEQNKEFEANNICWICGKLIDIDENKVRHHDHTKKGNNYTGAAHWNCNINLKISKKVVVIFHNFRGYDSHLIFKELSTFDCKVSVIPNLLEKYMSFTLNRNISFIDSMLFMNSSLDKLGRSWSDEDFKYLSREFSGEKLKLVKEKGVYPYEYMDSF